MLPRLKGNPELVAHAQHQDIRRRPTTTEPRADGDLGYTQSFGEIFLTPPSGSQDSRDFRMFHFHCLNLHPHISDVNKYSQALPCSLCRNETLCGDNWDYFR